MSTASDRLREIDRAAKEDGEVEAACETGAAILPQVADLMDALGERFRNRGGKPSNRECQCSICRTIRALHDLERAIGEVGE